MKKDSDSNVVPIGKPREELKPGDIVQLLVGGHKMVVGSRVKDAKGVENYVECYWVGSGIVATGGINTVELKFPWSKVFAIAALKRVKL